MPNPATTPAHEGGEREMCEAAVRTMDGGALPTGGLARDWLAMDAEITRLREALELAHDYITLPFVNFSEKRPNVPRTEPGDSWAYVAKTLSAALAGTSADAGARETVTVWTFQMSEHEAKAAVAKLIRSYFNIQPCGDVLNPFIVAITVTPGKERGT
jgi:hypothetical protein